MLYSYAHHILRFVITSQIKLYHKGVKNLAQKCTEIC